jgi:hypothetical protein
LSVTTKKTQKKSTATTEENTPDAGRQSAFERAIILRATDMSLGSIATNWETVLDAVKQKSEEYRDVTKYEGDDKKAKEDRALLRKQKDMTKTTIASIQEAWNAPLAPFLSGGREIVKQFDYAIDAIDEWVKEGEAKVKDEKKNAIQQYFDSKDFDLVPLDSFFDDRWLNKGYKLPDIKKEIDAKIAEIYGNIKVLENIAEYGVMAKALYLETLDMGGAMLKVQNLKENAAKLAREQAEREQREHQAQIAQNQQEQKQEQRHAQAVERVNSLVDAALNLPQESARNISVTPKLYTTTLRFTGTRKNLEALKTWMSQNGVSYEKVGQEAEERQWESDKDGGGITNDDCAD